MKKRGKTMNLSKYIHLNRIEFVVTWHCTGKCRHCSVGDKLNYSTEFHHVQPPKAAEAIRQLSQLYDITSVMTFGGEPLLYPEVTANIHRTAAECGIHARQLITNGFFSKKEARIDEVAQLLKDSGVNNLLLSVDAFHQETIPLEPVLRFAEYLQRVSLPGVQLSPAWLVNSAHENPYNTRTRELLSAFSDLNLPIGQGNDIFLAGNATKYLSEYYPAAQLDLAQTCGSMPYTDPLTDITSLSIVPNGDVMICSFPIGNIYQESIEEIVCHYDPYENECMRALLSGGASELLELAAQKGIEIDRSGCYSVCDLCRMVSGQIH